MLKRVRKRDGREVPFDEAKIRLAVAKALVAVGEEDPPFAEEVARLVRLTLENRLAGSEGLAVPSIEDVQDLVEQALIELGRAKVAKAYILYRDRRARIREALRVETSADAQLPPDPAGAAGPSAGGRGSAARPGDVGAPRHGGPRVVESGGAAPWSKGRIVAALMNEAGIDRELAERVAARVEARVFDAGLRRITTALVRELVDNELLELGLEAQLRRQGTLGLPRHDLRVAFETPRSLDDPVPSLENDVAGAVLSRFALEEVLSPELAERHLVGDFELVGLDAPHRYLTSGLPADLLGASEPSPDAAFELVVELANAARSVSAGVVLEQPARALAPLVRARSLGVFLSALEAAAIAGERRFDLGSPGPRATAFCSRLIGELAARPVGPRAPRLFVDGAELEAVLRDGDVRPDDVERLLATGRLIPTWSTERLRFAAPGARRTAKERAAVHCGGALCVNLPRLARRAGPWREDRLFEGLAEVIGLGVRALFELRQFQDGHRSARPGEVRGRVQYALGLVGLREALGWIADGEVKSDQAARVVGFAADAAQRLGRELRLAVVPTPFFAGRASERFCRLDAERERETQGLFFTDVGPQDRDRPTRGARYSVGYRLSRHAGSDPGAAEAEACRTVGSGALTPPPSVGPRSHGGPSPPGRPGRPGAAGTPALAAWRTFEAGRTADLREDERPRSLSPSLFESDSVSQPTPESASAENA